MEAALELEDDVFYKDLSKQISLLIMDDDDEDSLAHCPSVNLQAFTQAIHPARQASFLNYDNYQQTNRRESSKGTGVFIPRSSHPRRKNNAKQARFSASGNKFQTPCEHNSRGLPHMAYSYSNNINPSHDHYYSVNLRRF